MCGCDRGVRRADYVDMPRITAEVCWAFHAEVSWFIVLSRHSCRRGFVFRAFDGLRLHCNVRCHYGRGGFGVGGGHLLSQEGYVFDVF